MGLHPRKGPEQGPGLVGRALRDLRVRADPNDLLGGASVDLSEPLPLYRLALESITDRDGLAQAEHVGWRYLIEDRGQVAFADVKESGGEPARFASLSRNENARRLMEAAQLCEAQAVGSTEDFDPRILEVPSLNTSALWLLDRSGNSTFIPFIDVKRLKGAAVQIEDDFLDDLIRRAEQVRAMQSTPSSSPQMRMGG